MVDATTSPIPRPNRRQSQTKSRPKTAGWDSLIENAFAQQPTPNITPRNSMLTNPTIPSITVSTSAERLYEPAPVNSSPAPQSPHTRPESLRKTPSPAQPSTSQQIPKDLTPRPVSPASTATKFSPIPSSLDLPPEEAEDSLDPVWAKVRAKKLEKMMALPSKVKSLEGHIGDLGNIMVGLLNGIEKLGKVQEDAEELEATKAPEPMVQEKMPEIKPVPELATGKVQESQIPRKTSGPKKTIPKKPSMVTFKESPDGQKVTATFDMVGVRKQDMHVTYRTGPVRLVVVWRRIRTVEKMEDRVLVRERQEKQYSQIIPLPEGTKFKEIRATRDGKRLTLTYPNPQPPTRVVSTTSFEAEPTPQPPSLHPESIPEPSVMESSVAEPQPHEAEQGDPLPPEHALSEAGETEFYTCIQIDGDDDWSPYSTPTKR